MDPNEAREMRIERKAELPRPQRFDRSDDDARYNRAIDDAGLLLDYAVTRGLSVADDLVTTIRGMQARAGDATPASSREAGDRAIFESAYRDLARRMRPVTAQTLRATASDDGQPSQADKWSRTLWRATAAIVAMIVVGETFTSFGTIGTGAGSAGATADASTFRLLLQQLWTLIEPFAYGGLGACTYLLRNCQRSIYHRTFDPLQRSEDLNRLLLGVVSGGAVAMLFARSLFDPVNLGVGAAALAFLTGYNADFLFATIERVVAAVFPRVELYESRMGAADMENGGGVRRGGI